MMKEKDEIFEVIALALIFGAVLLCIAILWRQDSVMQQHRQIEQLEARVDSLAAIVYD